MQRISKWLMPLTFAAALGACATNGAGNGEAAPSAQDRAALGAHHWWLVSATGANGQDNSAQWRVRSTQHPVQLTFGGDRSLSVQNLCNALGGQFQTQGSQISVDALHSTKRACADQQLMQLEQRVASLLPRVKQWSINSSSLAGQPMLTLRFADGSHWNLQGTPTNETRYGSKPEIIFLEVAGQPVQCGQAQCLQVRQVQFNDQGVQTSQGPWEMLPANGIEGFSFEPGFRSILRVGRYLRQTNAPADATRYVYVLDLQVQTERVH